MKIFLDHNAYPVQIHQLTQNKVYAEANWKVVKNYYQFIEWVRFCYEQLNVVPDCISFDYDLCYHDYSIHSSEIPYTDLTDFGLPENGYKCAEWLSDYYRLHNISSNQTKILTHGTNEYGNQLIKNLFN